MANNTYFTNQVITYLGNKRLLIKEIEQIIKNIIANNYKSKENDLTIGDLFSGSGVVARMLKTYAHTLIVNDFEPYSALINSCFLTNKKDFDEESYDKLHHLITCKKRKMITDGVISTYYAPKNDDMILEGERCFYTKENAILIDTYRYRIEKYVPKEMQKFFLASLLYSASVHVNTGGMFKGFYKDKYTKVGKFGGTNADSLKRILGKIKIEKPILGDYDSDVIIYCEDTNNLVTNISNKFDIVYLDPPYNQHPYGSNYFMLNVILNNNIDTNKISKVSGIPSDWKRSPYYKITEAKISLDKLIKNLNSSWILLSYSSDGIIPFDEIINILKKYGKIEIKKINYCTLKSGRNRRNNKNIVTEYIFILKKEGC